MGLLYDSGACTALQHMHSEGLWSFGLMHGSNDARALMWQRPGCLVEAARDENIHRRPRGRMIETKRTDARNIEHLRKALVTMVRHLSPGTLRLTARLAPDSQPYLQRAGSKNEGVACNARSSSNGSKRECQVDAAPCSWRWMQVGFQHACIWMRPSAGGSARAQKGGQSNTPRGRTKSLKNG